MINEERLLRLYADVEVLKLETTALRHIAMVLATRLCELSPESSKRTQSLLATLIPYADHAEVPACGGTIKAFFHSVSALTEGEVDAASVLLLRAMMGKEAGPARIEALAEWHSQATEDEIAQDVQQMLAKLRVPKDDSSDESNNGSV